MTRRRAPRRGSNGPPPRRSPDGFALHAEAALSEASSSLYRRLAWVVVGLLGLALLAVALGPHRIGDNFAETDFYGAYADGARALQHGRLDPARYGVVGPGYEAALAVAGFLVPDLLTAAELLSLLSLLAGLGLWIRLLGARADARLAFVAALFLAVNPTFFRYGYSATNDALTFALQAASLCWLLVGAGARAAFAAGLFGAFAFLTRYNALALLPAGLVAVLTGGTRQPRRAQAAAAFTAGFIVPVVPWVLFSLSRGGSFSFQFHHNIAYDVFARAKGIPWDDYQEFLQPQFKSLADVIARNPGAVLRRELFNVWDHLRLDGRVLLGTPVAACAVVGFALAWLDGTWRRLWPVGLAAALFFLTLVPVFYSDRYGLPLLPIYAALAAAAFTSPRFAFAVGSRRQAWLKGLVAVLPLALSLQTTALATRRSFTQLPVEVLECARTLRALARPGDQVICRKAHIAFHGGVRALGFPFTRTLPELAAYAREHRARWLYFSWPEAEMRPAYWYLLDTAAVIPGLAVRRATVRPAVLYEIGPEFGQVPPWFSNDTLLTWHAMRARLRVNPLDTEALLRLADIEFTRGQLDSARHRLELAVGRRPRFIEAWLQLAEIALIQEDGERARQAYERALAIDPRRAEARVGLGWASLVARDPRGAAALWRPVIGLARDPATVQRMIDLYHALGDLSAEAEARAALARLGRGP